MKAINQNQLLDEKIRLLKNRKDYEFEILKEQFTTTKNSLKPINIIKETISDLKNSKDIRHSLLESAAGIAGGYLTKKNLIGKSSSILKKVSGIIIQYVVTNFITHKAETRHSNKNQ